MGVDVYVKDLAEIRHFVSEVQRFSEEYLTQLSRIKGSAEDAYRTVEHLLKVLQKRLEEAESEERRAERALQSYLDSFRNAKDQDGKPIKPDPARVQALEEDIERAKEKVYRASRRLQEGQYLAQEIKQRLTEVQVTLHSAYASVAERSQNVCVSVNKAADRIENYIHS